MKMIFGPAIKRARVRAGLKQSELAERLGITRARLSHLESGHRPMREDTFLRCAVALGMTPVKLLGLATVEEG